MNKWVAIVSKEHTIWKKKKKEKCLFENNGVKIGTYCELLW